MSIKYSKQQKKKLLKIKETLALMDDNTKKYIDYLQKSLALFLDTYPPQEVILSYFIENLYPDDYDIQQCLQDYIGMNLKASCDFMMNINVIEAVLVTCQEIYEFETPTAAEIVAEYKAHAA